MSARFIHRKGIKLWFEVYYDLNSSRCYYAEIWNESGKTIATTNNYSTEGAAWMAAKKKAKRVIDGKYIEKRRE